MALTAQDTVGIDVALVEETQRRLLALFPVPPGAPRGGIAVATLCAGAVAGALYKATNGLLDDLHRNVRLLGTPERCGAGHVPRVGNPEENRSFIFSSFLTSSIANYRRMLILADSTVKTDRALRAREVCVCAQDSIELQNDL